MAIRHADGSAGDADYGDIGAPYAQYRQPDPRIAAVISQALGDARTVLNVGAGAGSYEPADRDVTPVEPSASMRGQRPARVNTAVDAVAEDLPFANNSFDAAMTTMSVHQWSDLAQGLREVRRVTRGPAVVLAGDTERLRRFWLNDYAPEVLDAEARRFPSAEALAEEDQAAMARAAMLRHLEREVDPDGKLSSDERAVLIGAARRRLSARLTAAREDRRRRRRDEIGEEDEQRGGHHDGASPDADQSTVSRIGE